MAIEALLTKLNSNIETLLKAMSADRPSQVDDGAEEGEIAGAEAPVKRDRPPRQAAAPEPDDDLPKRGRGRPRKDGSAPGTAREDAFFHDPETGAFIKVEAGEPLPTRKSLKRIDEQTYLEGVDAGDEDEEPAPKKAKANGKVHEPEPEPISLEGVREVLFKLRDYVAKLEGDPEAGKAAAKAIIKRAGRADRLDEIDPKRWPEVASAARQALKDARTAAATDTEL